MFAFTTTSVEQWLRKHKATKNSVMAGARVTGCKTTWRMSSEAFSPTLWARLLFSRVQTDTHSDLDTWPPYCAEPSIQAHFVEPMWQVICLKNSATNKHTHTRCIFFWTEHSSECENRRSLEMLRHWPVWNNHNNTRSAADLGSAGPLIISITGTSWLHLKAINVPFDSGCVFTFLRGIFKNSAASDCWPWLITSHWFSTFCLYVSAKKRKVKCQVCTLSSVKKKNISSNSSLEFNDIESKIPVIQECLKT